MCLTVRESHLIASFLQLLLGIPPRAGSGMFFITLQLKHNQPAFLFPSTVEQLVSYKYLTFFFFDNSSDSVCAEWRKMEQALEFLRLERSH